MCDKCHGTLVVRFQDGTKKCADCGNIWDEPRMPTLEELLD